MPVYCDASLLVSFVTEDRFTDQARRFFATSIVGCVSDFAAAEVASAISGLLRMRRLDRNQASSALAQLDSLREASEGLETTGRDVDLAASYLRRLDLPLRTPDALNLALAARARFPIGTFDEDMRSSATALGLALHDLD